MKITEIFYSLQGEAYIVGWPTVFVRLTVCPLRCTYCDTAYAFHGGKWTTIEQVLETVAEYGARRVCVTGGEPLAQKNCLALIRQLADAGHEVSLETSGAMDVSAVDARCSRVVDVKTPASGEVARNRYENLALLGDHDQVKFVIGDRADYDFARQIMTQYELPARTSVLLSPSHDELAPGKLADWMLEDRLQARLQVQLHKYLWGDVHGR
ncbi:MAG: 7-carboxy-7-deazaguanine synthase QueE [Pseudomonadota bacterium]